MADDRLCYASVRVYTYVGVVCTQANTKLQRRKHTYINRGRVRLDIVVLFC